MKKCFPVTRSPRLQAWKSRSLRTLQWPGPQESSVRELSNAELLELFNAGKEEARAELRTQVNSVESQEEDGESKTAAYPAANPHYQLPLSPLVDPGLVAARTRHKAEKPSSGKNPSTFQLKLRKNPYAYALVTPTRLCLLTSLRLPSYFHVSFGLATHPKTGAPWHLPRIQADSAPGASGDSEPESNADASTQSILHPNLSQGSNPSLTPTSPTRTLSGTHFLASRRVLKYISTLKGAQYRKLMPYRWKEDSSLKVPEIVWREDMDSFVLGMLRNCVFQELKYLASRPAAYIAATKGFDSIGRHGQVAAALWLGDNLDIRPRSERQGVMTGDEASSAKVQQGLGPPLYAMTRFRSHYRPIYNLLTLLGPVHLRALRESSLAQLGGNLAVIKLKKVTLKVQLYLWKLSGYLADEGRK